MDHCLLPYLCTCLDQSESIPFIYMNHYFLTRSLPSTYLDHCILFTRIIFFTWITALYLQITAFSRDHLCLSGSLYSLGSFLSHSICLLSMWIIVFYMNHFILPTVHHCVSYPDFCICPKLMAYSILMMPYISWGKNALVTKWRSMIPQMVPPPPSPSSSLGPTVKVPMVRITPLHT